MALKTSSNMFKKIGESPKNNAITVAGGTFFLVVIMIMVAIRPAVASVIEQIKNNDIRRDLLQAQEEKIDNLEALIERADAYSYEIELLNEVLPEFKDTEFVVQNLAAFDRRNTGIDVESVIAEEGFNDSPTSEITPIILRVDFYTDSNALSDFLEYVETFPMVLSDNTLNVTFVSEDADGNTGNLPLEGSVEMSFAVKNTDEVTQ